VSVDTADIIRRPFPSHREGKKLPQQDQDQDQANAQNHYTVTRAQLPLSCPTPGMALWNSHPRVYLPVEVTGTAKCPYCGASYTLVEDDPS